MEKVVNMMNEHDFSYNIKRYFWSSQRSQSHLLSNVQASGMKLLFYIYLVEHTSVFQKAYMQIFEASVQTCS